MKKGVAAVVLAAGTSSRFGSPKLLQQFGRATLLERTLDSVGRSRVEDRIVVLGHEADNILRTIDLKGFRVVINPRYREGMSSSLRVGIDAVRKRERAAIIILADQPFLTQATIDRIIKVYEETGARVIAPTHRGRQANPVLFDRSLFGEISGLSGDRGAKKIIRDHWSEVQKIEMDDPLSLMDIDTPKDLKRALRSAPRADSSPLPTRTAAEQEEFRLQNHPKTPEEDAHPP